MRTRDGRVAPRLAFAFGCLIWLAACAAAPAPPAAPEPAPEPVFELEPATFDDLEGWRADDPREALIAFRRSCEVWRRRGPANAIGAEPIFGRVADWLPLCADADTVDLDSAASAQSFFEIRFQPYLVRDRDDPEGLFTGYYEPLLQGSRAYGDPYTVPLHLPPRDLQRVDLAQFNPNLSGFSIYGQVVAGRFVPYHSRADIEAGALSGKGLEFLWVDDEIDRFFLQIQGSGQVRLTDGTLVRVGYAGQNGHPYRAIGRDLMEIGAIPQEQISLQSIRAWLQRNPSRASDIMERNRSYIFFQENDQLGPNDGPLGAQGVSLTAERSLAIDPRYLPLGAPIWLETTVPFPEGDAVMRRLMIAQDTGGAIKGIVRGDVFWGAGERAEAIAGRMRGTGRYAILLPRALTPVS